MMRLFKTSVRLMVAFCLALVVSMGVGQPKEMPFNNTASYAGNGKYRWTVYVDADSATLARIRSVEYTLHPTFPNPVQTVTTRQNKFALSAIGWGEFTIYAKVQFTDGKTGKYRYRLNLTKAAPRASENMPPPGALENRVLSPKQATIDSVQLTTGNTSHRLSGGNWEWSVFIVAANEVLTTIQYVEYTLHPTFPEPIQRVTERGTESGKGFMLKATGWGTFEIAVKVVFINGTTRYLKHQLKFG